MTSAQQPVETKKVVVKKEIRSQVKKDGVIKEQVRNEEEAKIFWDRKWSNLVDECQKILIEEAAEEGMSAEEFTKFRITKPGKRSLVVDGWKYEPSEPFPVTSSGMVGWRSSRQECNLERFGSLYVSPRFTIKPPGRPPTPPQQFIMLG